MAESLDAFIGLAHQHVDQIVHAESLAGAMHAGQRLLRRFSGIPGLRRFDTGIAVAAGHRQRIIKVGQQRLAAAGGELAQTEHGIELVALDALARVVGFRAFQHLAQGNDILQAVHHPGIGRQAVASGAAGFLIVGLDTLRQVQVRNETHVRLVDAHAEGDGRDHDHALLVEEARLIAAAYLGRQPGMIRQRIQPLAGEIAGDFFHALARQAVNDAGIAGVFGAQETQQLLARAATALGNAVADVGAVETADEHARVAQTEARDDLAARGFVGGGGQRNARDVRKAFVQHRQLHVLGAEVVAPLRHAVRLVDGEQRNVGARQEIERAFQHQALGGHIEQIEFAVQQLLLDGARGFGIQRGIEKGGAHPGLLERRHLVLHERDQRRDDQPGSRQGDGRNLEAQRLAAAGGHEHQRIAAVHQRVDHLRLRRAELFVTEDGAEDGKRLVVHDELGYPRVLNSATCAACDAGFIDLLPRITALKSPGGLCQKRLEQCRMRMVPAVSICWTSFLTPKNNAPRKVHCRNRAAIMYLLYGPDPPSRVSAGMMGT